MSKNKKTAMEAASAYLANRMRTVQELRKYLKEKEYDTSEIDATVDELISLHYLDDNLYAERYYEYNREKKRGIKRAAAELKERGVDEAVIKNAGEDFLYNNKVDEYEDALSVGLKVAEGRKVDDKLVAKIARKLEAKGYGGGDILRVLETIRNGK